MFLINRVNLHLDFGARAHLRDVQRVSAKTADGML